MQPTRERTNSGRVLLAYHDDDESIRRVAHEMAHLGGFDVDAIEDARPHQRWAGRLRSHWEAYARRTVPIVTRHAPSSYDLVIIGTPVWQRTMTSPARSYLVSHRHELERVAFFCTMASCGAWETLREMAHLCNREPVSVFFASNAEIEAARHREDLTAFVKLAERTIARPAWPAWTAAAAAA